MIDRCQVNGRWRLRLGHFACRTFVPTLRHSSGETSATQSAVRSDRAALVVRYKQVVGGEMEHLPRIDPLLNVASLDVVA